MLRNSEVLREYTKKKAKLVQSYSSPTRKKQKGDLLKLACYNGTQERPLSHASLSWFGWKKHTIQTLHLLKYHN